MSCDSKFWKNLRNGDVDLYRRATLAQRSAKKLRKHELDLKLSVAARDTAVYLKFTRWKNVKNNSKRYKSNLYRRVLLDEIHNKHQSIKQLRKDLITSMENRSSASYLEFLLPV